MEAVDIGDSKVLELEFSLCCMIGNDPLTKREEMNGKQVSKGQKSSFLVLP